LDLIAGSAGLSPRCPAQPRWSGRPAVRSAARR